jgi:hypothetical protein
MLARLLAISLGLALAAGAAFSQAPQDELMRKQLVMLAAEAEFFSALALSRQGEIDRLKANPCEAPK